MEPYTPAYRPFVAPHVANEQFQRTSPTAQPLSTALYTQSQTLDFATRLAKILARRTGKPTYVGNSISFAGAGLGGTVEEEMEGMGKVVEVVLAEVGKASAQEDGT